MSTMFDMGEYGLYVWTSYAAFALMLAWDLLMPWLRRRRFLRSLGLRLRRDAARAGRTPISVEQNP